MSSPVIRVADMEQLEVNIVEILCNLERIFPPGFFDSMENLLVHLPYEAKIGGPVQYRWMYPFERFLGRLKKKVTNRNKVEASVVNAYLNEEVSRFCSLYFQPSVQTKMNRFPYNDDGGIVDSRGSISVFSQSGRPLGSRTKSKYRWLSEEERDNAHRYVLMNCAEINPIIEEFFEDVKKRRSRISQGEFIRLRDKDFPGWLWKYWTLGLFCLAQIGYGLLENGEGETSFNIYESEKKIAEFEEKIHDIQQKNAESLRKLAESLRKLEASIPGIVRGMVLQVAEDLAAEDSGESDSDGYDHDMDMQRKRKKVYAVF